jgi:hypothetical protein
MTITETQNPIGKNKEGIVRKYEITGPQHETVESFWQYLVDHKIIASFEIS